MDRVKMHVRDLRHASSMDAYVQELGDGTPLVTKDADKKGCGVVFHSRPGFLYENSAHFVTLDGIVTADEAINLLCAENDRYVGHSSPALMGTESTPMVRSVRTSDLDGNVYTETRYHLTDWKIHLRNGELYSPSAKTESRRVQEDGKPIPGQHFAPVSPHQDLVYGRLLYTIEVS
jgi:hypothetical protein